MQRLCKTDSVTSIAHTYGEMAMEEIALTWEAIVINIAKGSQALPKVSIIGTVTIQGELLFQHSLASKKQNRVREMVQALDEASLPHGSCPCDVGMTRGRAAACLLLSEAVRLPAF